MDLLSKLDINIDDKDYLIADYSPPNKYFTSGFGNSEQCIGMSKDKIGNIVKTKNSIYYDYPSRYIYMENLKGKNISRYIALEKYILKRKKFLIKIYKEKYFIINLSSNDIEVYSKLNDKIKNKNSQLFNFIDSLFTTNKIKFRRIQQDFIIIYLINRKYLTIVKDLIIFNIKE